MKQELILTKSFKRLDAALSEHMPDISRNAIKKAILNGCCSINGVCIKKPDCKAVTGQKIIIDLPAAATDLIAEKGAIPVLYQDENLVICNKPANLTTHPCQSCTENTVVQRLLYQFPALSEQGGERPGIVHRLDKDTTGILVVALSETMRLKLSNLFNKHEIHKEYLALVEGKIAEEGECRKEIGRHPVLKTKMAVVEKGGKTADTSWKRLWYSEAGNFSLVSVCIKTGRTHQIRVHMSYLGYPILGDRIYAPKNTAEKAQRQMLHAWHIKFVHPETLKKMEFFAPMPEDFCNTVQMNSPVSNLIVVTGNPGSGKSFFCDLLSNNSIPAISADGIVLECYKKNGIAAEWLKYNRKENLLLADGNLDRTALFNALQKDYLFKKEFQNMVHETVFEKIKEFCKVHKNAPCLIAEIPLFFECGWQKRFLPKPFIVGISCDDSLRKARLQTARNWSEEKIQVIESWQWPQKNKIKQCDFVAENNGSQIMLKQKAKEVLESFNQRQIDIRNGMINDFHKAYNKEHI